MSDGVLENHSHCSVRVWYTGRSLIERRKTEHKSNTICWNLTSWRLDRSFNEFFSFSLVNNHSTNSYQWPILNIRMSGLAERYKPPQPTSRSVFVMPTFTCNHQPATLCSLNLSHPVSVHPHKTILSFRGTAYLWEQTYSKEVKDPILPTAGQELPRY